MGISGSPSHSYRGDLEVLRDRSSKGDPGHGVSEDSADGGAGEHVAEEVHAQYNSGSGDVTAQNSSPTAKSGFQRPSLHRGTGRLRLVPCC
jgi:hypothetical protein